MQNKKEIIKVSYPIFLGLLAQNIINVTDTAFLGHVGEVELGASALGGLYYICLFTLAFGFSIGAQILMARRNGEGKYQELGTVLNQGSLFSFLMAIVLLVGAMLSARPVMQLMLSSEVILEASYDFFSVRVWGLLFSFVNVMYRAFYVAIIRTKVLTLNAIVMASINVILDYILIFGKFGAPRLGLEGAAIASVMAEAGSLLFFLLYTRYAVDGKKYGLKFRLRLDFPVIRRILNVSVFMMLQQFIPFTTWFVFFLAIEHIGQRELAIANVVRSIYVLVLIPVQALSTTVNTLVSNAIGSKAIDRVTPIIRQVAKISVVFALCCAVLMVVFPHPMLAVYTNDLPLIEEAVPSLWVIAGALLIAAVSNICFSGISGTGNTRSALMIELSAQVFYAAYILVTCWWFKWSVAACFTCEVVYYGLLLIGSACYFRYFNWQKTKI